MTALAVIAALVTVLCIGDRFGRRAGSTPSTWRKRTSQVALGRLAIRLVMLMTVRRIRQSSWPGACSRRGRHLGTEIDCAAWAAAL
jgi:hypothetical protein